jgi:predicted lipoprotein with Yx(FWY)xxD motif
MKTLSVATLAVLGASALLVAGCGSGKKTTSAATPATLSTAGSQSSSTAYPGTTGTTGSSQGGASGTGTSGAGTTVTVKHSAKLGTVLAAGSRKMTVYLFEADRGPSSACAEACAGVWPPVTTSGPPVAAGAAVAADLGTIKRADGTTQVTYKGHPLYYFVKDKDSGDSYGQGVHGFGSSWYVLSPRGGKIDNS